MHNFAFFAPSAEQSLAAHGPGCYELLYCSATSSLTFAAVHGVLRASTTKSPFAWRALVVST